MRNASLISILLFMTACIGGGADGDGGASGDDACDAENALYCFSVE